MIGILDSFTTGMLFPTPTSFTLYSFGMMRHLENLYRDLLTTNPMYNLGEAPWNHEPIHTDLNFWFKRWNYVPTISVNFISWLFSIIQVLRIAIESPLPLGGLNFYSSAEANFRQLLCTATHLQGHSETACQLRLFQIQVFHHPDDTWAVLTLGFTSWDPLLFAILFLNFAIDVSICPSDFILSPVAQNIYFEPSISNVLNEFSILKLKLDIDKHSILIICP